MFPTRGVASVLLLSAVLLCACQLAQGGVSFLPNDFKNEDKKAPTEVVQRRSEGAERYTDDDTEQIKILAPLEVGIAMSFDEYRKYGAILNEMFKELLNVDLIEK
ncbi:appetite-regulating hormone-like [Lethenteron reissneri]|uniref:appetite-regulating hormone-like n=1 Tax=Lethenteron reissneri TaxID=7753 RepID=UPI002AB7B4F2|nr:appetite-regulating hormone-like [Lethenteron reissneri]